MAEFSLGEAVLGTAADMSGMQRDLDRGEGMTRDWMGRIGNVLSQAGTVIAGGLGVAITGVVTLGGMALGVAQDFDNALDTLLIRTGATGPELDVMGEAVKRLDGSFVGLDRSMEDIAVLMAEVRARTGLTGPELENLTNQILTLSDLTGTDATANVATLTRVFGDWGIAVEEQSATLDMLFAASQQTGIGVDTLGQLLVQFGAPLRQMGFTLDESIAMLAKWEAEGVNTELVLGSLRIAAGNFAEAGIPLNEGLMDTFDAIKNARTESEALTLAMDVFGARAGPDMAAAIREGRFEFDELVTSLTNSEGAMDAAVQGSLGFSERWQMAISRIQIALEPLGTKLLEIAEKYMPFVENAITALTSLLDGPALQSVLDFVDTIAAWAIYLGDVALTGDTLNDWIMDLGFGTREARREFAGFLDGIIAFLTPIGEWITQNVSLQDVLIGLGAILATVVLPVLWGVITAAAPIIAVVGLVIGAVALLRQAWETDFAGIRTFFTDVWENRVQPGLALLWEWLQTRIPPVLEHFRMLWEEKLQPALERIAAVLSEHLGPLFEELTGQTGGADAAMQFLDTTLGLVVAGVDTLVIGVEAVANAFEWWHNTLVDVRGQLQTLEIPDWLQPGSPTPLELGVRGINRAIADWRRELPYLAADLRLNGELAMAVQGAAAAPQERLVERHENYNLAIHSNARAEDVEQDFYQMKARAAAGTN